MLRGQWSPLLAEGKGTRERTRVKPARTTSFSQQSSCQTSLCRRCQVTMRGACGVNGDEEFWYSSSVRFGTTVPSPWPGDLESQLLLLPRAFFNILTAQHWRRGGGGLGDGGPPPPPPAAPHHPSMIEPLVPLAPVSFGNKFLCTFGAPRNSAPTGGGDPQPPWIATQQGIHNSTNPGAVMPLQQG